MAKKPLQKSEICQKCGEHHPKCTGHKKRKNSPDGKLHPCMGSPMKTSRTRKCYNCGGKTPKGLASPNTKHGKYSKYLAKLPQTFAADASEFKDDPALIELREAVSVQKVRNTELFAELGEREPVEVWRMLKNHYLNFREELLELVDSCDDENQKAETLAKLEDFQKLLINGCAQEEKHDLVWRKIEASQERLRKLAKTESKRLKDSGEYISKEGFTVYNLTVQQIIMESIPDAAIRNNISEKFIQAGL